MPIVFDTNILMDYSRVLEEFPNIILPMIVLEELDRKKIDRDRERASKARKAIKKIDQLEDQITFDDVSCSDPKADNVIIECAIRHGAILVTNDIAMKIKAKAKGLHVMTYLPHTKKSEGYVTVKLDDEELAEYYTSGTLEVNSLTNEYILIEDDDGNVVEKLKNNGSCLEKLQYKMIRSMDLGDIKPIDVYQEMAIDSLFSNQFSVITGKAGSGKSLLSLAYSLEQVRKGKYRKLTIVYNSLPVRGTNSLGFYPGTKEEKLLQSSIGNILISKLGGIEAVENLMQGGLLEIIPMSDIRGVEIDDSICYVTEAQNLSVDLAKLLIQRSGDTTKIILEGDIHAQVDSAAYEGVNNGINRAIEIFSGESYFAHVHLPNIYRSEIARKAEDM